LAVMLVCGGVGFGIRCNKIKSDLSLMYIMSPCPLWLRVKPLHFKISIELILSLGDVVAAVIR